MDIWPVDYDKMEDDGIIALSREGDRHAEVYLLEKYKDIVRMKASSVKIKGAEKDDLIQEGMIGVLKAIKEYDPGRNASFSTFCNLVVSRHILNALRNLETKKNLPLNGYVSIYQGSEETGETENVPELTSNGGDPEKLVIARENTESIGRVIEEELSPFEKEVLYLRITGMKNGEIAETLGKDKKSTDNALTRIRTKLGRRIQRTGEGL